MLQIGKYSNMEEKIFILDISVRSFRKQLRLVEKIPDQIRTLDFQSCLPKNNEFLHC